jgi:succinate-acetate transporter protein
LRVLKLRKLEALKVGGVQKEEEKENSTFCLRVGKLFLFLAIFTLLLFLCTLKEDF